MKTTYYLLLFVIFNIFCENGVLYSQKEINYPDFNTTSASKFLEVSSMIQEEQNIKDHQWQELFKSDGYRNYLVYSDSIRKKELIKHAMLTVFNPKRKAEKDSLLSLEINVDQNYFYRSLVKNYQEINENFSAFKRFVEDTETDKIIKEAVELARSYLPKRALNQKPQLYPVYLIAIDPDGQVAENAIVIDLNLTYHLNHEGIVKFIAHEFHHNYRKLKVKEFDDPLLKRINHIHQEGLADLIDKEKPPVKQLYPLPQTIIDAYNEDFQKANSNLIKLDSIAMLYFSKKIDEKELDRELSSIVRFGGHTIGLHMSFLIKEHLGVKLLIDTYDDPIKFFEHYNDLATHIPGAHVLSDDFISGIIHLSK